MNREAFNFAAAAIVAHGFFVLSLHVAPTAPPRHFSLREPQMNTDGHRLGKANHGGHRGHGVFSSR
jgi:hypothetical protein